MGTVGRLPFQAGRTSARSHSLARGTFRCRSWSQAEITAGAGMSQRKTRQRSSPPCRGRALCRARRVARWFPAFAGMTVGGGDEWEGCCPIHKALRESNVGMVGPIREGSVHPGLRIAVLPHSRSHSRESGNRCLAQHSVNRGPRFRGDDSVQNEAKVNISAREVAAGRAPVIGSAGHPLTETRPATPALPRRPGF